MRAPFLFLLLLTVSAARGGEPPVSLDTLRGNAFGEPVVRNLELLIEKGTDRYGDVQSPLWMAVLDAKTVEAPQNPGAFDENERVIRRGRRAPGGSNFFHDQPTLGVAYALSELSGEKSFKNAADAYLTDAMNRCVEKETGLFLWGWHTWYEAFDDTFKSQSGDHHEIHIWLPLWEQMYRLNPTAVSREMEAIWQWHICDKKTGECNRHSDGNHGLAFAMSGSEFIYAFMEMHRLSGDAIWKERAHLVSDWHWKHRNPETNLTVNVPNGDRFDGAYCDTSVIGLHAGQLLIAADRNEDKQLRERAVAYLRGYAEHGYCQEKKAFYGMVQPDGAPLLKWQADGYNQYAKPGILDLWEVYILGYAFPLCTAQAYAHALRGHEDVVLEEAAVRWADWIATSLPPRKGEGTYADQYGRCISFYMEMYRHTGERKYRETAVKIARDALKRLDTGRLLKSHPAKPYYEAADGMGLLFHALLELALDELNIEYDLGVNL